MYQRLHQVPGRELPERLKSILEEPREVIAGTPSATRWPWKSVRHAIPHRPLPLGQARVRRSGAAVDAGLLVASTRRSGQQAVVGNGHAGRNRSQEMVKRLLRLSGVPERDAADALACAICMPRRQGLGAISTPATRVRRRAARMIGRLSGVLLEKNPRRSSSKRAAWATRSRCR